jgi:enamine deaminase RidA (YjgF/YER057c/UK114 family)
MTTMLDVGSVAGDKVADTDDPHTENIGFWSNSDGIDRTSPMGAEARLKELGLVLPALATPVANYLPYRLAGNLLFLAGQGPRDEMGRQLTGKLGAEISIEEGYRRARLVGLGLLAAMREALGSLDRVDFVVKLLGMVNAVPDFNDSPKVINGC